MPTEPPKCRKCPYKLAAKFKEPTIEQIREYVISIDWPEFDAEYFYHKCKSTGWTDKNGKPYVYWKSVIQTWKKAAIKRGDLKPKTGGTFKERYLKENE